MTSYQARKSEVKMLKYALSESKEFERMMKNYIRAINSNDLVQKLSIERWFVKHSPAYAKEIGLC